VVTGREDIPIRCLGRARRTGMLHPHWGNANVVERNDLGGSHALFVLLVGVTALFVVAGPGPVSRAAADDAQTCANASGDEAIAA
jgi:hypothetical protein